MTRLPEVSGAVVGVFEGPWDTGWSVRDGAVLGFEDVFRAFSTAANAGELKLLTAGIDIVRDYQHIQTFLAACDVVYANCGPWAALLHLVREREQLDVRIIREVRTVGWIGYIWQEEVAAQLARPGDQRVFPSRYARDMWDAATAPQARGAASDSRIYYPMISHTGRSNPGMARSSGTVGFFSALSRDKGFADLPNVISRMRAGGHHIDRLLLAGQQGDPNLYSSVLNALSAIDVEVSYHGGLPNGEVRKLMRECDVILFLTVSSIESLGRVMVEASAQGVPVLAADFGAARDLVNADYRIPVKYLAAASRPSDIAFPLAHLDLARWQPPARVTADDCYRRFVSEYSADAKKAADILRPPLNELPAEPIPVTFSFACQESGLELANELLDEPDVLRSAATHELLDLGGTLKQYLLSSGYNPRVTFTPVDLVVGGM